MSAGLPKMIEAAKSRVGILSKSKKLPANVTKEKFDAAKADLAAAAQGWTDAMAAYSGGGIADAVAKAKRRQAEDGRGAARGARHAGAAGRQVLRSRAGGASATGGV